MVQTQKQHSSAGNVRCTTAVSGSRYFYLIPLQAGLGVLILLMSVSAWIVRPVLSYLLSLCTQSAVMAGVEHLIYSASNSINTIRE